MMKRDLIIAPVCEAALIGIIGAAGLLTHQPLIFTSLGPTAYELVETPHRRSARPYSIVVGHSLGVAAGFFALWLTGARFAPAVSTNVVAPQRLAAAAIATALTVFFTLLLQASQPAALSTTLLIALGSMQRPRDAVVILIAVGLMTLAGWPLRAWRLRTQLGPNHVLR